ncbi:MAG: hypothetical protein ACSLE0_08120 [Chitinophagaceae bacterium]
MKNVKLDSGTFLRENHENIYNSDSNRFTEVTIAMDSFAEASHKANINDCNDIDKHNRYIMTEGFAYCPDCGKEF